MKTGVCLRIVDNIQKIGSVLITNDKILNLYINILTIIKIGGLLQSLIKNLLPNLKSLQKAFQMSACRSSQELNY